jgi:hypothetical protein
MEFFIRLSPLAFSTVAETMPLASEAVSASSLTTIGGAWSGGLRSAAWSPIAGHARRRTPASKTRFSSLVFMGLL